MLIVGQTTSSFFVDELYGDFEDLETGEVHSGKTSKDDDADDDNSDADTAGEDKEESEFV